MVLKLKLWAHRWSKREHKKQRFRKMMISGSRVERSPNSVQSLQILKLIHLSWRLLHWIQIPNYKTKSSKMKTIKINMWTLLKKKTHLKQKKKKLLLCWSKKNNQKMNLMDRDISSWWRRMRRRKKRRKRREWKRRRLIRYHRCNKKFSITSEISSKQDSSTKQHTLNNKLTMMLNKNKWSKTLK